MESLLNWGVDTVAWFQRFSPALDVPFKALTFMGSQVFFMLLLPLLYWCLERRVGAVLMILFLASAYTNALAKVLLDQPRPFEYDPTSVLRLHAASGGGLPSGHTQHTTVVWIFLATHFRKTWFWAVAAALLILIPLSRVYLGLHFPTDLMGGYLLGAVLLLGYFWLGPPVAAWLMRKGTLFQVLASLLVPALLLVLLPMGGMHAPMAASTLMGTGLGLALERRWVGFESGGTWRLRALRYLVGVPLLFALWVGLRGAFQGLQPELLFRIIRYALLGLWLSLGAPWVFVRLRLAPRR